MAATIPPQELLARFTETVRPFHLRVAQNLEESRALAAIRDTILPKLISGKINVKDAQKTVGAKQYRGN
ncbi:MAG: type I restriction endonuclease subunit S [Elusimicrobia bacterium]|nr:type I restriction endonuclease subunit S [Elusimicrobiota bacterium]